MQPVISLAALLLAAQAVSPPSEPPTLAPKGAWMVRAEENMCLLERVYPSGSQTISFIFQPMLDMPSMDVFVVADDRAAGKQFVGTFATSVAPAAKTASGSYLSVFSPGAKARITRLSARRDLLDGLVDGDTLRIVAKPIDVRLTITNPSGGRFALRDCIAALKKSWGMDPAADPPRATPIGDLARSFGPDAYPFEALRQGIYGRVIVLLSVDTAGRVGACRVLSSAGAVLNDGTCKAAQRARFTPAHDAGGKPVASGFILPVRWLLPGVRY